MGRFSVIGIFGRVQRQTLLGLLLCQCSGALALPPEINGRELNHYPSKIIRTCCAFGLDLSYAGSTLTRSSDIIAPAELGSHHYLGHPEEINGIVYTRKGGFIDIAHLRDVADWTGYLYHLVMTSAGEGETLLWDMGSEAGDKELALRLPLLDTASACELAGRIAFDLSVWHEISTWYGSSYIPLLPERYSSFSPEDLYSNLLGVTLGIKAIRSERPFNEAMTVLLTETLRELLAVESREQTREAMLAVEGVWWSHDKPLPSGRILMARYLQIGPVLTPWRLPQDHQTIPGHSLHIPGHRLQAYYTLRLYPSLRFRLAARECKLKSRVLTQADFGPLVDCISRQVRRKKLGLIIWPADLTRERKR
ncbi:MAG: DUF4056 domain-containing protein [Saprospiraceae bacterium]|nr:DUF4056 domain-containing protein [Saprospiraceae bacterium]